MNDRWNGRIFRTVPVTFAPEMGNEYQGSTAHIDVKADAVQVANNGETVLDALGWPQEDAT